MSVSGGLWKQQQNPARPEVSVLRLFSLHTVRKKKGASTLSSWGAAMLLLRWSPKELARDFFYNSATRSGLTHDVTDTEGCAQNGSSHGRAFATFQCGLSTQDHKCSEKMLLFFFLFFFFFFFFFFTLSLL